MRSILNTLLAAAPAGGKGQISRIGRLGNDCAPATCDAIAIELQKILGQPVTVENRPGAGGNIGGAEAVRAAPDGYTLLMTTSGINAINPALYAKMPFDPIKDMAPVVALVSLSNVLVVHPSVKANSLADRGRARRTGAWLLSR